jgi:DnaJ-class molecular chaperone
MMSRTKSKGTKEPCKYCNGIGFRDGDECEACDGTGEVYTNEQWV